MMPNWTSDATETVRPCIYQGKAWMMQLLSVACLSLAAKMEENEVPLSLDLQVKKISQTVFTYMISDHKSIPKFLI